MLARFGKKPGSLGLTKMQTMAGPKFVNTKTARFNTGYAPYSML